MLAHMIRHSLVKSAGVTAWSLATLTASAALATIFFTISMDVGEKMSKSLRRLGANAVAHSVTSQVVPDRARAADVLPAWAAAREIAGSKGAELLQLDLRIGKIQGAPAALVSADLRGLERMTPYWAMKGHRAAAPDECVMGRRRAELHKLSVGASVEVRFPDAGATERYRLAGVFESGDEDEDRVFIPPQQRSLQASAFTYALVSSPGGEPGIAALNESLSSRGTGIELTPLRQVLHGEQTVLSKINLLAGVALLAVLVLSSLGVTAAVLSRVMERRKELALLQALGAKRRSVVAFLLSEGAAVGVAAAVVGFAIGTALSHLIVHQVFGVSVTPHATAFLAAAGVTVVMALLAATIGARRALRMETALLLKGE